MWWLEGRWYLEGEELSVVAGGEVVFRRRRVESGGWRGGGI